MTDDELIKRTQVIVSRGKQATPGGGPRLADEDAFEARWLVPSLLEMIERRGLMPERVLTMPESAATQNIKYDPLAVNEDVHKDTCGFVCPTPGYMSCRRPPHTIGPCAHEIDINHEVWKTKK